MSLLKSGANVCEKQICCGERACCGEQACPALGCEAALKPGTEFFREERGEFARGRYAAQRRASLLATQICIGMNMETAQ